MDSLTETKLEERFDIRIISLYSRGVQDGIPQVCDTHFFHSFCYYDAIRVTKVNIGDGPMLRSAYFQALRDSKEQGEGFGSQQFLVAAVDVLPEKVGGKYHGYTADEIERFWEQSKRSPLFFVSMINLKNAKDLDAVLTNIRTKFPVAQGYLAYLTFDHCDLILFAYKTSFHDYTKQIFRLCFGCERVLDDVITIYGFNSNRTLLNTEEKFRTLIRIGVRDFPMALKFQAQVKDLEYPVSFNWLLGRNDISILCENTSLAWLMAVRDALIGVEKANPKSERWYTTYDLTVFSPDQSDSDEVWFSYGEGVDCEKLTQQIDREYAAFEACYKSAFQRLQEEQGLELTPNMVWLRWLKDSCSLAVSLMGSRLSVDLATCLVPQFLDLLRYGTEFFSSGQLTRSSEIDDMHTNFNTFFSNTAVLVDSVNQTNRQFVQVPAFHLPSFNLPPQLLAYYTVLAQRLCNVLQDDKTTIYSLAVSPDLVNILQVTSFAIQDVLPDHQWISISMDETSFYTLKMTTETLAHEISHFIGENNRERKVRKSCIMRCAFQIIFLNILDRIFDQADQYYGHLEDSEPNDSFPALEMEDGPDEAEAVGRRIEHPTLEMKEQADIANRLWTAAAEFYVKYKTDQMTYSRDLDEILWDIPHDIYDNPELSAIVFDEIWHLRETNPDCLKPVTDVLCASLCRLNGGSLPEGDILDGILKERLAELFYDILQEMSSEFEDASFGLDQNEGSELCRQIDKLCYMFGETFADLQAILLLNMKWCDYAQLLSQHPQRQQGTTIVKDCPLRMLAVAKVLLLLGEWTNDSMQESKDTFEDVRACIHLDCERVPSKLREHEFNPTFLRYLTEYLSACVSRIKGSFASVEREQQVQVFRDLHSTLSDETSMYTLQNTILMFIEEYRTELLGLDSASGDVMQEQNKLCGTVSSKE